MTYKPDPSKEISEETLFEWGICIFTFPTVFLFILILDMIGQINRIG
jgi:hypothetical protein